MQNLHIYIYIFQHRLLRSFVDFTYFIKEKSMKCLGAVLTIHHVQYVIFYQGKKQIILQ